MKKTSVVVLVVLAIGVLLGSVAYTAGLTGDQILQKIDAHEAQVSGGNLITTIRFDNVYADGTTAYNVFGGMSKKAPGQPDKSLIYFEQPADVAGTIFLSIKPEGKDARMWLYLPALGMAKELVAEQQKKSFAGSTFSYKDIGSRTLADKFTAKIIGDASVKIEDKSYDCYVLKLTAKPNADVDYPIGKVWIDKTSFLMLKSEDYSADGKLQRTMEVLKVGTFEGNATADKMIATNVIDKSSTTITFLKRIRPAKPIPDSVFDPNNLASFNPKEFGFSS